MKHLRMINGTVKEAPPCPTCDRVAEWDGDEWVCYNCNVTIDAS